MVYNYGTRTPYKRSTVKRRVRSGAAMPVAIVKTPKRRRQLTVAKKPELKTYDTVPTSYGVNTTPSITSIFMPPQGTDYNMHTGRVARPTYLEVNGTIALDQAISPTVNAGASSIQQARLIILWDKEANTALPTITQVLQVNDPLSQYNLDNRLRFQVLVDKSWFLGPATFNGTSGTSFVSFNTPGFHFRIKKKLNKEVVFNSGTTGVIGDVENNSLIMIWLGDRGASNFDMQADVSTRVRFYDA